MQKIFAKDTSCSNMLRINLQALPSAVTWKDQENILLSEMPDRKTITI